MTEHLQEKEMKMVEPWMVQSMKTGILKYDIYIYISSLKHKNVSMFICVLYLREIQWHKNDRKKSKVFQYYSKEYTNQKFLDLHIDRLKWVAKWALKDMAEWVSEMLISSPATSSNSYSKI